MDSRARGIKLFCLMGVTLLLIPFLCVNSGCFISRTGVKLDYISFTLDHGFEWQAGMTQDIDLIGIYDEEITTPYAVIGILGPFTNNEIYEIVPMDAETITIGDKEILTFPMQSTLKSILGITGEYTIYVCTKDESGVAVFSRNDDKYIEETKKIIESMGIRT